MCTCTPLVPTRFFFKGRRDADEQRLAGLLLNLTMSAQEKKKSLRVLQEHTEKRQGEREIAGRKSVGRRQKK